MMTATHAAVTIDSLAETERPTVCTSPLVGAAEVLRMVLHEGVHYHVCAAWSRYDADPCNAYVSLEPDPPATDGVVLIVWKAALMCFNDFCRARDRGEHAYADVMKQCWLRMERYAAEYRAAMRHDAHAHTSVDDDVTDE